MLNSANNGLRIIVIDDNPAIHQDFKKILTLEKTSSALSKLNTLLFGSPIKESSIELPAFEIDIASQGKEGVERIESALNAGNPYALAFVDVRMPPGWDGIETIQYIWKLDNDIQIVICTAYSDYSWEETIEQLGMTDSLLILKKPFDSVAVRQLAFALTKKWKLTQDNKINLEALERKIKDRTVLLQESLSLTRATLESSINGIIVVSNDNKVVDWNQNFIDMWSLPNELVEEKNYAKIFAWITDKLINPMVLAEQNEKIQHNPNTNDAITLKLKDGQFFELYSQPQKMNQQTVGRVWSFQDVSEKILLAGKLEHQATHDPLTELPNRAFLLNTINAAIVRAKKMNNLFAVLFIDLDRFKLVNDSFSHEAGDILLKNISAQLKNITAQGDTIARLSGDEFIFILMPESLQQPEDIIDIANKLLNTIMQPIMFNNREFLITASMGISLYPQDGNSAEELIRHADLAMYNAKSLGGNQYQFYTPELHQHAYEQLDQESALRKALLSNEFYLEYQPQFDVSSAQFIGVEALIRWRHPQKGILMPIDFIPLAEETGLIVAIGEWVLRTACLQNKAWQDQGYLPISVAVNVAFKQFLQPNFINSVKEILQQTGLMPQFLEIEVTENVIIKNAAVSEAIKELKNLGVKIVLDDFGTGNSSLGYLRSLPIDQLKIDQSFIKDINKNHSDATIVKAIISIANSLEFEVIAEGVENSLQMNFLRAIECDKLQGYYFSYPLDPKTLEDLFTKKIPHTKP